MRRKYPHVIVKYMDSVYCKRRVIFLKRMTSMKIPKKTFVVNIAKPFDGIHLTLEALKGLLDVVEESAKRKELQMCIVLDREHCIYINPDGSKTWNCA